VVGVPTARHAERYGAWTPRRDAVQIEISDDEARVLRDVLTTWLGEVSTEIRHTDSPAVRRGLRERRDCVRRVRDELGEEESAAS
jgi:hypothetical protein